MNHQVLVDLIKYLLSADCYGDYGQKRCLPGVVFPQVLDNYTMPLGTNLGQQIPNRLFWAPGPHPQKPASVLSRLVTHMQGGALGFLLHPKNSKWFFGAPGPHASKANTGAEQACNPYARGCLGFSFAPQKFQRVFLVHLGSSGALLSRRLGM